MSLKSKNLNLAANILGESIEGSIRKIKINEIKPDANQPRKNKDINIEQLAQSLKDEGLLQPIIVTREGNHYSIIAGERRFRAAQLLGWKEIECRIISRQGKDKFRIAVIENLQRENLDPIEEALSFKQLKKSFSYTDSELSKIIGKSRNYISEILSIAEISPEWLEKAETVHLKTKNILVQFAQSIKIDKGDDFLQAFQEGTLNTVKDAKRFIQTNKVAKPQRETTTDDRHDFAQKNNNIKPQPKNFASNIETRLSKDEKEPTIHIHIEIKSLDGPFDFEIEDLNYFFENQLKKFLGE